MNDLEQYEMNAIRRDNLIDSCENSGHPYHTYKNNSDISIATICSNCHQCVEYVNTCPHNSSVTVFSEGDIMCNRCHHQIESEV